MQRNSQTTGSHRIRDGITDAFLIDRRKFLNFVQTSVHDPVEAEEILQRVSLKVVARAATLRDPARAKAWIYRLLRNEITDHFRRLAVHTRRTAELSNEIPMGASAHGWADRPRLCPCAGEELANLRPNYAEALRGMEMQGEAIATYAARKQLSVNNATVLLHRARKALRARLQTRCGTCAGPGCFDRGCAPHSRPSRDR